MSTPATEPVQPTATVTEPAKPAPATKGDAPLGENGEKALKAEREARATAEKEAAALKKQLEDIEAAKLSDLEKAQKATKEAQDAAATAATEALRYRIAAEKGITEDVELILTAPDEETMRKQADLWASRTPNTQPGPRPDLTQGAKGAPVSGDPAADFANFLGTQMSAK